MRISMFAFLMIFTSCAVRQKASVSSCSDNKTISRGIIGTRHCSSIALANGVIIRTEEINPGLLKSVSVVKCPESYIQLGDIGTNGFILVKTSQIFDYVNFSSVDVKSKGNLTAKPKMYFLNGYLITSDTVKISPKAIRRIQILNAARYNDKIINSNTVLINIWTLTKKEVRHSQRKCNRYTALKS